MPAAGDKKARKGRGQSVRNARLRAQEEQEQKIKDQVADGSLVIRQATIEEREAWERIKQAPENKRRHRKVGTESREL